MNQPKPQITETGIEKMFDKIAFRYDFLNRLLSAGRDQAWRRALVSRIPVNASGSILDVATGTGDVLVQIAKARPKLETFRGVDISEKMLKLARQKFEEQAPNTQDVAFKKMSARKMLFENHTFDYITISFGLRNVVDPDKAMQEFSRCLKANGKLLILEFLAPSKSNKLAQSFFLYFNKILPKVASVFSDKDAYSYLPQSVAGFYDLKKMADVGKEAGFKLVYSKSFIFGYCRLMDFEKVS